MLTKEVGKIHQWCLLAGIQLAEISTLPQSVVREAKEIAKKLAEEKKVSECQPLGCYLCKSCQR